MAKLTIRSRRDEEEEEDEYIDENEEFYLNRNVEHIQSIQVSFYYYRIIE